MQRTDVQDTRLATRLDPRLDLRILVGDRSRASGRAGKKGQTRGGKGDLGNILRTWRRNCVFLLPQIDSQPTDPIVDIKTPLPTRILLAIIGKRIFLDFRRPATGHANLVSGVGSAEMDRSSG